MAAWTSVSVLQQHSLLADHLTAGACHQLNGSTNSHWDLQVAMYERLLADASIQRAEGGANEGEAVGPGKPALTAAQKRLKYLKIGAAAVGGGALLAVTGICLGQNPPRESGWYSDQGRPLSTACLLAACMQTCWMIRPCKTSASASAGPAAHCPYSLRCKCRETCASHSSKQRRQAALCWV